MLSKLIRIEDQLCSSASPCCVSGSFFSLKCGSGTGSGTGTGSDFSLQRADSDQTHHLDADPDPNADPAFDFYADPDPKLHSDADPDPTSQNDADPDPKHWVMIQVCSCLKIVSLFTEISVNFLKFI
jgi:hypothetical protein